MKDIYIPRPCHEDWNKMTPTEKGKFCKACSKEVYDFTNSTYSEIEIIFKNSKDSACGTFYEDQLNQDLKYLHKEKKGFFYRWRLSAISFFTILWLKIFTTNLANAQEISDLKEPISVLNKEKTETEEKKIRIKGIFQKKDNALGAAFIKFKIYDKKGKLIVASKTDVKGEFEVGINESYEGKELTLKTKNTRYVGPRSVFIYRSTEKVFTFDSSKIIIVEIDVTKKKKFFAKKRIVMTGKFRM